MAQQTSGGDSDDAGRSRQRVEQDLMLEREARRESWLARLWRRDWLAKGRPKPGNRAGDSNLPNRGNRQ